MTFSLCRLGVLLALAQASCSQEPGPTSVAKADAPTRAANERDAAKGRAPEPTRRKTPPLAKNDPRFKPYVPKPKQPLDFTGVDVGDEALDGAPRSLDALGRALVDAVGARQRSRLHALQISESEYKERFFPILIYHRSALKLGEDLGWSMLRSESNGDLDNALGRWGGHSLSFVRLETDEVLDRPKVRIHRKCTLTVRLDSGEERSIPLINSILEHVPSSSFRVIAYDDR